MSVMVTALDTENDRSKRNREPNPRVSLTEIARRTDRARAPATMRDGFPVTRHNRPEQNCPSAVRTTVGIVHLSRETNLKVTHLR